MILSRVAGFGNQCSSGLAIQFLAKNIVAVFNNADAVVCQKRKKGMVRLFQGTYSRRVAPYIFYSTLWRVN